MFKALRIIALLLILATVAQQAWVARARVAAWQDTLYVGLYPIAADSAEATRQYVAALRPEGFAGIEAYFRVRGEAPRPATFAAGLHPRGAAASRTAAAGAAQRQCVRSRALEPADALVGLAPRPHRRPQAGGAPLRAVPRSRAQSPAGAFDRPRTRHARGDPRLRQPGHGRFQPDDRRPPLLHTLGATDKYDPATNLPRFPEGYAEPEREPRHPQEFAEIMGGRIPLAPTRAEIPRSLADTLVGPETAREIGWLRR